tara:strand:- start:1739 stop:1879 length:141 start_codon:yes stop_codon:yes gene_type:complete
MEPKVEIFIDLIFYRLKKYKAKEINLKKEDLREFFSSLLNEKSNDR